MPETPRSVLDSGKEPATYRLESDLIGFAKTLCVFFGMFFFIKSSVVEAFKIPSSSMEPTLLIGDHILVNKLSYGFQLPFLSEMVYQYGNPERGEVVVFSRPDQPETSDEDESDINIIKRVIGIPGDLVEVKGTKVYLNGEIYREDPTYRKWVLGGIKDFGPVRVPDNHVLLLGDNRDQSKDSRFWEDSPFLDIRRVKGRAFIIYWNKLWRFERIFKLIN